MTGEIAYTFDGVPLLLANLNRYYALLNMGVNTSLSGEYFSVTPFAAW